MSPQPKQPRYKKLLIMIVELAAKLLLIYILVVAMLFFMQRKMIYFPYREVPDLSAYGARNVMEEVKVTTSDGLELGGWYATPASSKMPVLVWFHGNAGDHGLRYFTVRPYIDAGYGVLLPGYRGYGGNPGKPSEKGFYSDARAWLEFLIAHSIEQEKIVLYGESIGTGVAVQMALEYKDSRALVLQSPYTSITDVARKRYFFIPVDLLMLDRFRNIDKIEYIGMPLLILQGDNDSIIPASHGRILYEKAKPPKQIKNFEGYGHNDMPVDRRAQSVIEFISQ